MERSRRVRLFSRLFLLSAVLIAAPFSLFAQDATGRIVGNAYDQSGAVIPGARIVITNTATLVTRETVTDASGAYQVLALPIGAYTVTATHKGFNPIVTHANKLEINQSLKIDVKLTVGTNAEIVTVEGSAATVETINPTLGSTVSELEIANAPLNGRNVLDLALLQPGVLPADNPGNGGARSATLGFSISGGRNDSNTFLLDGGANNDLLDNGAVYNPNPDAVEEFKVLTSNFGAEYGRNGGGIVTVVTKSGTNTFHGSVFEYNRNDAYNANDFLSKSLGKSRAILKRNQYGGTFGGPIVKRKLFFFFAYQGQKENRVVPSDVGQTFTPAELQGDFTASTNQASVATFLQANPFFQPNPNKRGVLPGDPTIIDPTKIDPVALAYIKAGLIPSTQTGTISFQNPAKDNRNDFTGKFDWEASDKDHMNVTLGRVKNPTVNPGGFAGAPASPQFTSSTNSLREFSNFAYTRVVSPAMLNEFRATVQRTDTLQATPSNKLGTPQSFGTTITPDNATAPPLLTFPTLTAGFSPQGPSRLVDNTFAVSDTFSWTRGKHTMKFGGSFSAFQDNQVFDFFVDGNFDFQDSTTGAAGDALANFLVGVPDSFFQAPAAPSNIRTKATYVFGQDEWHLASNLVLTYGLRYEYSTPKSDTLGRTFSVVPGAQSTVFPGAPQGLLFPGDKGAPTGANFPDKNDFAPRFGFAWQPFKDSKTSVRGGIGIFYDVLKAEDNFQFNGQIPFASSSTIFFDPTVGTGPNGFGFMPDPFGSTGSPNPFPSKPIDHTVNFASTFGPFGGIGVFFVDPHLRTPYTYQYNLSIEHEIAKKMTVQAAYVGSSSHGLTGLKDINPFDPATVNTPTPTRILDEGSNPLAFSFLPQFMNVANANYNALQLSLKQQSTSVPILGSMYYTLGYTYAHSIDSASGFRNNNSQVPFFLPNIFRASSDYDLRHVITFNGGWDLPFNHGPQKLVKGWSLFPIVSWRTGYPFSVTDGLSTSDFGANAVGPSGEGDKALVNANLVSPIQYLDAHTTQTVGVKSGLFYFNPSAFSKIVTGPYGTAPRNAFRLPGRTNMDLSLTKTTPIYGDHVNFKFNIDAFNIFNHAELRGVSTNVRSPIFGRVTSDYSPRILQLGAHIIF